MNRTLFSTQAASLLLSQSQSPNLRLEQKQYRQPFLFQWVSGLIPSPCVWRGLWDKPLRGSSICSLWQCIISGRFPQSSFSRALGWMLLSQTHCVLFVFLAVTLLPVKRLRWEADQAVSVCWWLRNDEGQQKREKGSLSLILCQRQHGWQFASVELWFQRGWFHLKRMPCFPIRLIKLTSLNSRMPANLKTGKHFTLLQFTFGLNSIQRGREIKRLSFFSPEGTKNKTEQNKTRIKKGVAKYGK